MSPIIDFGLIEPPDDGDLDHLAVVAWMLVEAERTPRWRRILGWRPWRRHGDYKRVSIR